MVFERGHEEKIPVIDIGALVNHTKERGLVAGQIAHACREYGFFYISNHGVAEGLQSKLESVSREFFAQRLEKKLEIGMKSGGTAWRGYFPIGDELTSGMPDEKEGLYFGAELAQDDPRVASGVPMHGRNLFPSDISDFREATLEYIAAMTELGRKLMYGLSLSLGLEESYFEEHYTKDPFVLFRVFNYPPSDSEDSWGVGEHTDYGLLTILKQDDSAGLEVRVGKRWIKAPPIPGTFVCNIGDMLDRMTGGSYRSTPHRVRNLSGQNRLSFPFFFDPSFDAEVHPIPGLELTDNKDERWDLTSVHEFNGTYGDYLLGKVAKVFPDLGSRVVRASQTIYPEAQPPSCLPD
ncbi:MAG: 2-oxoglutarate and iron-dependent oxygenase domain-containing protein [Acidobacteriota bacterium]